MGETISGRDYWPELQWLEKKILGNSSAVGVGNRIPFSITELERCEDFDVK